MRSARVLYARRGPPLRTAEGMTSQHNILPECGMTDFRDAGRFFQPNVAQATMAMHDAFAACIIFCRSVRQNILP